MNLYYFSFGSSDIGLECEHYSQLYVDLYPFDLLCDLYRSESPLALLYGTSTMEHHHFDQCIMILNGEVSQAPLVKHLGIIIDFKCFLQLKFGLHTDRNEVLLRCGTVWNVRYSGYF